MNNEIRNELLLIKSLVKSNNNKDKEFNLKWLLERFETDINRQLEDLRYKENELKNNLELLNNIKKELDL